MTAVPIVTRPLAPIQPLVETEIVDRPLRNVRSLTDGSRPYRLAAWSPIGPYVALLPQDGPGLDLVDTRTGAITSTVTGTYVLEPVWTDEGDLLLHQSVDGLDSLSLYDPERGLDPTPLVAGPRLAAADYASAMLAFVREDEVLVCPRRCSATPQSIASGGALTTAMAPGRVRHSWLAWTPTVEDLEQVQTVVIAVDSEEVNRATYAPQPLSNVGEGLWLPRWSPDATRVVMTGIGGRLAVATIDGSARQDLGPGDSPAWSADGRLIAFAGASAGLDYTTRDIHLIRADGTGRRTRLTDAGPEQLYLSPSWSPDGRQLAFVELDSGQLFVGNVPDL